jgi:hypothetical protein
MSPILTGVIASGISGHLTPPWEPQGAYDALGTVNVPSGGMASVTFLGIPSGYKHLQIRAVAQQLSTGGSVEVTLNNATFVRRHFLYGSGAGAVAGSDTFNAPAIFTGSTSTSSSIFAVSIVDILDYNSTKNKVTRSLGGIDNNGSGSLYFMSGLYTSTSPVTSITINPTTQNFAQHTQLSLYGVR